MQGGETPVGARQNELYYVRKPDGRDRGEERRGRKRQDNIKRKYTCVCAMKSVCTVGWRLLGLYERTHPECVSMEGACVMTEPDWEEDRTCWAARLQLEAIMVP